MSSKYIFLFLFAMLAACKNEPQSTTTTEGETKKDSIAFDWQAHRGGRGLMPENTIMAFIHALEYPKVTTLELDLVVSKDRNLIVSHEPWMDGTICKEKSGAAIGVGTERKFNIYEMTYAEVLAYDCGTVVNPNFPEQKKTLVRKPSLPALVSSVEEYVKRYNLPIPKFNIEIKSQPAWDSIFHPVPPVFARLVVDAVLSLNIKDRTTIQSFDIRSLKEAYRLDSTLTLALLVESANGLDQDLQSLGFTPSIYSPYYKIVTPELVEQVHKKGMKIIPWTVNDTTDMRNLMTMQVDGIITDYPNLISVVDK